MKFELNTKYKINVEIIKKFRLITQLITKLEKISNDVFFEVNIINNNEIKKINKKFRKIDKSTDVLAFSLWDSSELKTNLLGEIFISYEQANIQATELCHSLEREICFLFTHGLLHLLGYDHISKDDEKKMISKQKLVLEKLQF